MNSAFGSHYASPYASRYQSHKESRSSSRYCCEGPDSVFGSPQQVFEEGFNLSRSSPRLVTKALALAAMRIWERADDGALRAEWLVSCTSQRRAWRLGSAETRCAAIRPAVLISGLDRYTKDKGGFAAGSPS